MEADVGTNHRERSPARPRARVADCARGIGTACAVIVLLTAGCLEYSPHAVTLRASERDVHRRAVQRLDATPPPAVLRFAVVGDTQLRFDDARAAVDALNRMEGLSFVVQLGDFTHVGILQEFREMLDIFQRLSVPFFVIIGNHDRLGNGRAIYEEMFGPANDEFAFAGTRVLLVDTNSREVGFDGSVPDLSWLGTLLVGPVAEARNAAVNAAAGRDAGAEVPVVLFAHVAADAEDFDGTLRDQFDELLRAGGVRSAFHGHEHRFRSGDRAGIPFLVSGGVEDRMLYVASQRADGGFDVEEVAF